MSRMFTTREEREVQRALKVLFEIAEQDLMVEDRTNEVWRATNAHEKIDAADKILGFFSQEGRPVLK